MLHICICSEVCPFVCSAKSEHIPEVMSEHKTCASVWNFCHSTMRYVTCRPAEAVRKFAAKNCKEAIEHWAVPSRK